MYKLVAIDLDGTLLNSKKEISNEDNQTINRAIEKGIKIVVCSGRIYTGARIYAKQLGIKGPMIACNGAIIKDLDTNEVLFSDSLRAEDCKSVIEICHDEDVYFHIYAGETMYTEKLGFSSEFYWKKNLVLPEKERVDIRLVANLKDEIKNLPVSASKIVVISNDSDKLTLVRQKVEKINFIDVMSSSFENFEVVNHGVNKGKALELLSNKLGIERDEIIAIGDNENDHSMLQFAGLGVAMQNATDFAKGIADFITSSNDDNGVSKVLEKYVL